MPELFVRDSIQIEAAASRIWDVLTKSEYTRQYMFNCDAVSDWKVGSPLVWQGATDRKVYVKGAIVEIVSERRLGYTTFTPDAFDKYEDKPENYSTALLELTPSGSGILLSISQGDFSGIANGQLRHAHSTNTWRSVLATIKELAESG